MYCPDILPNTANKCYSYYYLGIWIGIKKQFCVCRLWSDLPVNEKMCTGDKHFCYVAKHIKRK